eukprot:11571326-Ditylum_brightwellii.AAC.1
MVAPNNNEDEDDDNTSIRNVVDFIHCVNNDESDSAIDGVVESDTVDLMVLADLTDEFGDSNSLPLTKFRN